jgi:hypothetical protein
MTTTTYPRSKRIRLVIRVALYTALFGTILLFFLTPTSIEIRLDCGDLRFKRWGIPISHAPMHEPERTTLLSLAGDSKKMAPEWAPIVPQTTSNYNAGEYAGFYKRAAEWDSVDRTLFRLMVEDIAAKINAAAGKKHVVPSWMGEFDGIDPKKLGYDWSKNPKILKFCQERGYLLETSPAPESQVSPKTLPLAVTELLSGEPLDEPHLKAIEKVRAALIKWSQTASISNLNEKVPELMKPVELLLFRPTNPQETLYEFGTSWQFSLIGMHWNVNVAPTGYSPHQIDGQFVIESNGEFRAVQTGESMMGGRGATTR